MTHTLAKTIDRRRMLIGTGATAAALAATSMPAEPATGLQSSPVEHPMETARRISKELKLAMEEVSADMGGLWAAKVYPAGSPHPGVCFENLDAIASAEKGRSAATIEDHVNSLLRALRQEAPGLFDTYRVKNPDGTLAGFAFVTNEAGKGSDTIEVLELMVRP